MFRNRSCILFAQFWWTFVGISWQFSETFFDGKHNYRDLQTCSPKVWKTSWNFRNQMNFSFFNSLFHSLPRRGDLCWRQARAARAGDPAYGGGARADLRRRRLGRDARLARGHGLPLGCFSIQSFQVVTEKRRVEMSQNSHRTFFILHQQRDLN